MMTVCVCGVMCGSGQPECRSPPSAPEAAPSLAPAPECPSSAELSLSRNITSSQQNVVPQRAQPLRGTELWTVTGSDRLQSPGPEPASVSGLNRDAALSQLSGE